MNNLLFDEPPLVLQPKLAIVLGDLEEAVILQQVHYWIQKKANIRDGYSWVYNTMAEWQKQFPWIKSDKTLRKKFKSLEDKGLLITGNYNKAKFDRTKWYRIDYDAFSQMVNAFGKSYRTNRQELPNATGKSYPTYTIDYTETTTDIGSSNKQADASNAFVAFQTSGATLNGFTTPQLVDYINRLGDELVIHAIEYMSNSASKPNFNYLKSILDSYENAGITTVEQAIEIEKKFKDKREQRRNSSQSNNNAPINNPRDLSNKHYGTAEEIERQLFEGS